jgi:hypothetical protein
MKKVLIIGIIALFLIPTALASMQNIVCDPSFESKPNKHHFFGVFDTYDDGTVYGSYEIYTDDSYTGKKCVHLQATKLDTVTVKQFIKGKKRLDDITEAGFFYKRMPGSSHSTPYLQLTIYDEDGYAILNIVQHNYIDYTSDDDLDWTYFNNDKWKYWYADGTNWVLGGTEVSLEDIQDLYDGYLKEFDVVVGDVGDLTTNTDVLVDQLIIQID